MTKFMKLKFHILNLAALLSVAVAFIPGAARAALDEWPLVLVHNGVTNTIYQPQLDSWDYYTLTAHAAVAVQPAGAPQPTFGVNNVTAQTLINRVERTVYFENLQITKADFPSAPDQANAWAATLQVLLPQ